MFDLMIQNDRNGLEGPEGTRRDHKGPELTRMTKMNQNKDR